MVYNKELASIIGKEAAEWFGEELIRYNSKKCLFRRVTTEELEKRRIKSYEYIL